MAQMRFPVQSPPVALGHSSATTLCVYRVCGAAMEMQTAPTGLTSGRKIARGSNQRRNPAVSTSFSVLMERAFTTTGGAMEARTAMISRTKPIAVILLVGQMSFGARTALVSMAASSVMGSVTAVTSVTSLAAILQMFVKDQPSLSVAVGSASAWRKCAMR